MKTFKQLLTESVEKETKRAKISLSHPEDLPFINGSKGFHHAINTLTLLHRRLSGQGGSISVKTRHGGNQIIFGHHPENGKFFVGTQAALRQNSIVNHTDEDVEKNHPALKDKLKLALRHLPMITPNRGVYGAELLHGEDDKEQYSVDNPEEAEKLNRSKIGIMIHSKYHGKKLSEMDRDDDVDHHNFGTHNSVNLINANHDLSKTFYHPNSRQLVGEHIKKAEKYHKKLIGHMPELPQEHIKSYLETTFKKGAEPTINGLKRHMKRKFAHFKTDITLNRHYDHIKKHPEHYENALEMYRHIRSAKHILLGALNSHKSPFTKGEDGYIVKADGMPIKMEDRYKHLRGKEVMNESVHHATACEDCEKIYMNCRCMGHNGVKPIVTEGKCEDCKIRNNG